MDKPPRQEELSASLDAADIERYLELRPGQQHAARMRALAEPHTATFLHALPDPEQNLLISNREFTAYCSFRLGRVSHEGAPCPVCRDGFLDEHGLHQVSNCRNGPHRKRRHDELVDELARHATRAGFQVSKDCSLVFSPNGQRPSDLAIRRFKDGLDASIDVVITNPLADVNLSYAAGGDGRRATTRAEDAKVAKYAALFANQRSVTFLPAGGSVYGGWGVGAEKVIEIILAAEADALRMKPGPLRWRLYARLGAILARGNARAILDRRPTHLRMAIEQAD